MLYRNIVLPKNLKLDNRIFYLDLLKAFAIFLVAVGHVSSQTLIYPVFNLNWIVADVYSTIAKISIPIFMMISGVLLFNRDYDYFGFIKKRYPRILIPVIFWLAMYVILGFTFGWVEGQTPGTSILSIGKFIFLMFLGHPGYLIHYWYVWLILSAYLIIPIINKWIKNSDFSEIKYFLIIWLVTCAFTTFKLPYVNLDLRYFAGPLGYFVLGYYLHNCDSKWLNKTWLWFIVLIVSTAIKVWLTYHYSVLAGDFRGVDYYDLTTVAEAFSLFLIFRNINFNGKLSFLKRGKTASNILSLSIFTFGIYLSHLLLFKYLLLRGVDFAGMNALISVPVFSIVLLVVAWFTMIILSKIPVLRKFTGGA